MMIFFSVKKILGKGLVSKNCQKTAAGTPLRVNLPVILYSAYKNYRKWNYISVL